MIALDGSHRLGGAALVAGSLLFLAAKLDAMSLRFLGRPMPDLIAGGDIPLILLGQLCLLIGFSGLYRFHVTRLARSGRIALGLLCGGGMALALGHVSFMDVPGGPRWATVKAGLETGFLLVLLGLLLTLVGLILLGLGAVHVGLPRGLRWSDQLAGASRLNREVSYVHCYFIGLACLLAAAVLDVLGALWMRAVARVAR